MASRAKDLLGKMIRTHETIYNEAFWSYFDRVIGSREAVSMLEVACGPGLLARKILDRYQVSRLTATDVSPTMLRHARSVLGNGARERRAAAANKPAIEVRRLNFDAAAFQFGSGPFDVAFVGLSFRNVADPVRFLRALRPHLTPGGVLIVYDFVRVPWTEFRSAWREHVGTTEADAADSESTFSRFRNFCVYTVEDVEAIATEAGYRLADHQRIDAPMALYLATLAPTE